MYNICVLDGDGIGPEICGGAIEVMEAVGKKFGIEFKFTHALIGGIAIDKTGFPLPEETVKLCKESDSVLLGAVGGPKWDNLPGTKRPEAGLLQIRKELGVYANIRPAKIWKGLEDASPLKAAHGGEDIEINIVRELTGGIYFGKRFLWKSADGEEYASDTEQYSESEIQRVTRVACELAMKRKKHIVSVDKANVLESSRLWRRTVHEYVEKHYPEVKVEDMFIDNAAMQLIRDPQRFDVLLTSNIFGDILSDEAAQITGSIGMLASSSLGNTTCGLYEPIHGSAPDIAGKDLANPIATILACAMMMRDSLGRQDAYDCIEAAVQKTLDYGYRTKDIAGGKEYIGCREMIQKIVENI